MQIDKNTARKWVAHAMDSIQFQVSELRDDELHEMAHITSQMTYKFFSSIWDLAPDPETAKRMVEHAAHGMSVALVQILFHTPAPSFDPTTEKVN